VRDGRRGREDREEGVSDRLAVAGKVIGSFVDEAIVFGPDDGTAVDDELVLVL